MILIVNTVRNMALAQGIHITAIGIVIGITAVFRLARFLSSFLFRAQPHDTGVFVGVRSQLNMLNNFQKTNQRERLPTNMPLESQGV
jgi:hypothetical protein